MTCCQPRVMIDGLVGAVRTRHGDQNILYLAQRTTHNARPKYLDRQGAIISSSVNFWGRKYLGRSASNSSRVTSCAGDTAEGVLSCVEPIYIIARPGRVVLL